MKRIFLCVVFVMCLHGCKEDTVPLETTLEQTMKRYNIPAMAAIIIYGDEIVDSAVAGVRVRGGEEKATLEDYWHLGSCTKAMTATLAGRLVEQGKIKWESTIEDVLPKFSESILASYRDVTLEELLAHRSGIPGDVMKTEAWKNAWKRMGEEELTPQKQLQLFCKDVLQLEPIGEVGEYLYSNQGYAVAGLMCSVAGGDTYANLMQQELFGPLGMESVGYGAPLTRGENQLNGHLEDGSPAPPLVDNPIGMTPAGLVHCTMEDWSKYIAANLLGSNGKSELLKRKTFQTLHTPYAKDEHSYAMGWIAVERPWGGGTVLTHSGSNTMFFCTAWIAPKRNFAVLIACNQGGSSAASACDSVASACIYKELERQQGAK